MPRTHVIPTYPTPNTLFIFRKQAILDLYKAELSGQISDGLYENAFHGTHAFDWVYMCGANLTLGNTTKLYGIPSCKHTKSNFQSLLKIPEVAERMLAIVKRTEPEATMKTVKQYITEISLGIRKRDENLPVNNTAEVANNT